MNSIRQTQALNKVELENCTPPNASWHRDYSDTAFIYIGGLDDRLTEGDVITIFSQYGEPVFLNLVRDKETGKSKGFAFLKYEDQRSCDLAVDNLSGASVQGRLLNVDHTRYKRKEDEDLKDNTRSFGTQKAKEAYSSDPTSHRQLERGGTESEEDNKQERRRRKLLKEEQELEKLLVKAEGDEDPMKAYLIDKKREEVEIARKRRHRRNGSRSPRRHREREAGDRNNRTEHRGGRAERSRRDGSEKEHREYTSRRPRSRSPRPPNNLNPDKQKLPRDVEHEDRSSRRRRS